MPGGSPKPPPAKKEKSIVEDVKGGRATRDERKSDGGLAAWTKWMHPRPPRADEVPQFWEGIFELNYLHIIILIVPPLLSLVGFLSTPVQPLTMFIAGIFYFWNGLGITAGYHRLFAHCAYKAHPILEYFMAFLGAGAFEGSIQWWARNHRAHHRYVDTTKDPYNATRGFWYTHVGWMVMRLNYDAIGRVDVEDLKKSELVRWQHKFYLPLALLSGVVIPVGVTWAITGDFWGAYFYAGLLKIVAVHHSTFLINSVAHMPVPKWLCWGAVTQTYSDHHSTFDNPAVAFVTNGEGYHNFHHEFPQDYRNGVRGYHYDPSKWFIRACAAVNLTYNLVRFPGKEIEKQRLQQSYRQTMQAARHTLCRLAALDHGPADHALPPMSLEDVQRLCRKEGRRLMVIDGYVIDLDLKVSSGRGVTHENTSACWYEAHPGGKRVLDAYLGRDATSAFNGGVYKHTIAARNLLSGLKVARLVWYEDDATTPESPAQPASPEGNAAAASKE